MLWLLKDKKDLGLKAQRPRVHTEYTLSNLCHKCFFLWADIFLSWTSWAETHMQSSCPVGKAPGLKVGSPHWGFTHSQAHRVNLTLQWCVKFYHTHKVQAPGSTWDLPSELYTHCSFCPCAQEITGHNRSDQNAMTCTETPGKFLFSRISLVAGFGGSWYGWAVHACMYWSAISTLVEITRAGDSQTVSNSCYRPQSLQFRLVSFPFLCYLTGGYREAIARLFLELYSSETRCNGHKLESGKLQLDVRELDI